MLKKLLSLSLVAVMLSVTALAAPGGVMLMDATYAAESDAIVIEANTAEITDSGLAGTVSLNLTSTVARESAVLVVAVYDGNGQLLDAEIDSEVTSLTAGDNTTTIELPTVKTEDNNKYVVKFFWWESKSTLVPVVECASVNVVPAVPVTWSGVASETDLTPNAEGYYEITTGEELAWFAGKVKDDATAKAKLMKDIYLNYFDADEDGKFDEAWYENSTNLASSKAWTNYMITGFAGNFDGNNKTIYGMYVTNSTSTDGTGFFANIKGATVKDVTFRGAYAVSNGKTVSKDGTYGSGSNPKPIAIVAGKTLTAKSTFENVITYGKVTSGEDGDLLTAGGIIGNAVSDTDIISCSSYVDVVDYRTSVSDNASGTTKPSAVLKVGAGGIIGFIGQNGAPSVADGSATRAYFIVNITNTNNYGDVVLPYQSNKLAGIVGHTRYAYLNLTNCGNAGKVRGSKVTDNAELYGYTSKTFAINHDGEASTSATDALPDAGSAAVYDATESLN